MQKVMQFIILLLLLFSALIYYNSTEKTLSTAHDGGNSSTEFRIQKLEEALAPESSFSAVSLWAEGVKTRNGALQYAVMSSRLREENFTEFSQLNWTTGTSSPWVKEYTIHPPTDNTYEVEFLYTDSTNQIIRQCEKVDVLKDNEHWYISAIQPCSH